MTTQKIRVTSWTQVTPGTKIYTSKSDREYYICIERNKCDWYFNNRKGAEIFLIGEQYLADSEEQYFIEVEVVEVEEKTEINNRLAQIAEQMILLQKEQQELEIKLAEIEREKIVIEEATTIEVGLQNAYNDYKNKLAKARKWFEFEIDEYVGDTIHDKIIVWNKKVYYSDHPAFKPGDKFSSHIMNCIAYRKKRTPDQGRRKKFN